MTDTAIDTQGPDDAGRKPHPWTDTSAHPWRRFLGRMVDSSLCMLATGVLVGAVVGLTSPEAGIWLGEQNGMLWNIGSGIALLALSIPLQALLIRAFGGGPGKWLAGVRVTDAEGRRLRYLPALWRETKVWVMGLGCGLPLVVLFALGSSYSAIESDPVMSWDDQTDDVVTQRPEGVGQTVGLVVAALYFAASRLAGVAVMMAGSLAGG